MPLSVCCYQDQVVCDVVPMEAGHSLVCRPCQYAKNTMHMGRSNLYTIVHNERKLTLAPLSPKKVHELQGQMDKEKNVKTNFLIKSCQIKKSLANKESVLLMVL